MGGLCGPVWRMGETRGETPTTTSLGARRGAGGFKQSPEVWWKWEWPSVSVIHIFSVKIEPDKLVSLEPLLEEDAFWQFPPHLAATSAHPCHSNSTFCEEKGWKCEVEFSIIWFLPFSTFETKTLFLALIQGSARKSYCHPWLLVIHSPQSLAN